MRAGLSAVFLLYPFAFLLLPFAQAACLRSQLACKVAPRSPVWLFPCSSKESVRRRSLRMSTESVSAERSAAQEYPDRTGWKPDNPYLAVFRPFIPSSAHLRELTPVPLIVGTLLGIVFGASSLYLVLKVGLTVSASIPVAVISITLFRVLSKIGLRDATILENNIVQTAGSAGESIAFGLGVTMPAIMILGFDLEITRVMLVAVLGGLIGILMMIPLRRALIVQQHGFLKYPEGTACAEVLKAGASQESLDA